MEQALRYCLKVRVFTKRTTVAIRIKAMPKKQVLRKQSQNRTLARVRNLAKSRIASRVPQTVPPVVPPVVQNHNETLSGLDLSLES